MKSRVFITGGSGLLALNWAMAIKEQSEVTLGIHDREIAPAGISTKKVDIESVDNIIRVFEVLQPKIVIHTAGLTNVEQCEAKPELAKHINVKLAANVAEACAKLHVSLVHISTDHLFSGATSLVDESYPLSPVNVYGKTKAEAECHVLEAYPEALVIRTNFYGWGTSYRRSFSDTVIQELRAGKELTLFNDVTYTPILAEAVAKSVHDLIDHKAAGIFHIVGDDRLSKHEFGLKLAQEFNLNSNLIKSGYITDRTSLIQRPNDMSLSNQKACKLLGRKLDGVSLHLARLHQQEKNGLAQELKKL
ncbi:MAG: NAD(P)-dependent oxidoreductase [Methylotenera sp.]|nr:NAD(P)-dependent oxidoreductase [Methylotenera sp.]